ncbi:mediator of RNA polymerase II transcription subunit 30-like isoform X2 [Tubulanus polymorphus]|uniref:mediator of RNA polymerase II transcription subunit 30-like isoform X2 n=1 Tax=Tubulanus polymorphus TaxID=672921 RepID=UPI003DA33D49
MALPTGGPGTPNIGTQPGTPGTPGQPTSQQQQQQQQQQYGAAQQQYPTPATTVASGNAVQAGFSTAPALTQQSSMISPTKEVNTASLCRIGQETVQDIVQKTTEMCNQLKATQVPNTQPNSTQMYNDRKAKIEELFRTINVTFKKLRLIYTKVNENCGMLDETSPENLIPLENSEPSVKVESTLLQFAVTEEKKEYAELRMKNCQMKEVIDQLRTIVWEINTMMAMRKT